MITVPPVLKAKGFFAPSTNQQLTSITFRAEFSTVAIRKTKLYRSEKLGRTLCQISLFIPSIQPNCSESREHELIVNQGN